MDTANSTSAQAASEVRAATLILAATSSPHPAGRAAVNDDKGRLSAAEVPDFPRKQPRKGASSNAPNGRGIAIGNFPRDQRSTWRLHASCKARRPPLNSGKE